MQIHVKACSMKSHLFGMEQKRMSLVKIEVVFADEQSIGIQLGRVPLQGEKIEIEGDIYEVKKLLHTPAERVDQYVAIANVGTGKKGGHPAPLFDIKINMGN